MCKKYTTSLYVNDWIKIMHIASDQNKSVFCAPILSIQIVFGMMGSKRFLLIKST